MAKSNKKQQKRALKKRKARDAKRRQLRHGSQSKAATNWPALDILSPQTDDPEQLLRMAIQKFAFQKSFSAEFEMAMALYFGKEVVRTRKIDIDTPEMADFQEWYFFDFVTSGSNRLVDLFAERKGPSLPSDQRQILHEWMETNRLRLLEIQEVTPGVGEVVKDLLSGDILRCYDISVSRVARKWMVLVGRPLRTQGRWRFTGSGIVLSPLEKDDLVEYANDLWIDYQTQNPHAVIEDFYRDNSLRLRQFSIELQKRKDTPPINLTAENHPLIHAVAQYSTGDYDEIVALLDEAEEFVYAGESQTTPGADHYNWLLRGRSHVAKAPQPGPKAQLLRTEWTAGPGEPSFLSLGNVTVTPERLELSCMSRQRLTAGRFLLDEILRKLIVHLDDSFTEVETRPANRAQAPAAPEDQLPDPNKLLVKQELLAREAQKWMDSTHPRLDNQTPREAANSAKGRAQLEEMLKIMEYFEEESSSLHNTAYNARAIRSELGLT